MAYRSGSSKQCAAMTTPRCRKRTSSHRQLPRYSPLAQRTRSPTRAFTIISAYAQVLGSRQVFFFFFINILIAPGIWKSRKPDHNLRNVCAGCQGILDVFESHYLWQPQHTNSSGQGQASTTSRHPARSENFDIREGYCGRPSG